MVLQTIHMSHSLTKVFYQKLATNKIRDSKFGHTHQGQPAVLQMRRVKRDNLGIIFHITP